MTSAHQAGVLEMITKEKCRGLSNSQEKGSSDPWKDKGFAQNKTDPVKWARPEKTALGRGAGSSGRRGHLGTELNAPLRTRGVESQRGHHQFFFLTVSNQHIFTEYIYTK